MMKLFDHTLLSEESIFSNIDSLDPDFVPKLLPHRENQQIYIADCIKPLLQERNGKNLLISGDPGIGKTASVKRVLEDLGEQYNLSQVFINCWKTNSSHKILTDIAEQLGFKFTINMSSDDLVKRIKKGAEKGCVFVFDEVDKSLEFDFLYHILEEVPRRTIILITNDTNWIAKLDSRIRSRMIPEQMHFDAYTLEEAKNILKERIKYSFFEGVWTDSSLEPILNKTDEASDIRIGIYLLREAGLIAEKDASREVLKKHVLEAIGKIKDFQRKDISDFSDDEKILVDILKNNSGKISGEIYSLYKMNGGTKSQRTVDRLVRKLEKKGIIELKTTGEGFKGKSSILIFKGI